MAGISRIARIEMMMERMVVMVWWWCGGVTGIADYLAGSQWARVLGAPIGAPMVGPPLWCGGDGAHGGPRLCATG